MINKKRRGLSPVVSAIIMSAAVVTVGSMLWSYTQGASTTIANDYINDVTELVNDVTERFTVEYVTNNSDCTVLHVWIYNYGKTNVTADVYVSNNETTYSSDTGNPYYITDGESICANITVAFQSADEVMIKVHSRRQNNAYATYLVP